MKWSTLWLVVGALVVGCTGQPAPKVTPTEPAAQQPEATDQEPTGHTELEPAPERASVSDSDPGDPEAQCLAGGAQACRTLCDAEAAICDKDGPGYDKDQCKEQSQDVPMCPSDPQDVELGQLCRLPPSKLSPTQGAVGMLAVSCKARSLEEKEADDKWKLRRYLMARPVPVVLASEGRLYLTDHHHLATGLLQSDIEEDDKNLYLCPMSNRISDPSSVFWPYMINNNFTWLHNRFGREIPPNELPVDLYTIGDDPFRTLSRWVRDSCGYIKCGTECGGDGANTSDLARCKECSVAPYFLEFRWADFMRSHKSTCDIPDSVYDQDYDQAAKLPGKLPCLMNLVRDDDALDLGLPGWNHGLIQTQNVVLDASGCEE